MGDETELVSRNSIRILYFEEDPGEAESVRRELEGSLATPVEIEVVEDKEAYVEALRSVSFDLVLADYDLPEIEGEQALELAGAHKPEVPFIFVSDRPGEPLILQLLRSGAADCVTKRPLSRLGPAVLRALREAEDREERRLAEVQLREAHQTMKTLVTSSPVAIFTLDRERKVGALWNDASEALFGWSWEEVQGEPLPIVPDERQWEFQALTDRVFAGDTITGAQLTRRRKGGTEIEISLSAAPIRDSENVVVGCVAFAIDVTEQKRAHDALRDSEERFKALFEHAPLVQYLIDTDGVILDGNRKAEELVGRARSEIVGRHFEELSIFEESVLPSLRESLDRSRRGEPTGPTEVLMKGPSGEERALEVYSNPTRLQGREVILGTIIDASERKNLEEELRRSQRMEAMGRLAGGVAHDFNNILTAINGYVHLSRMRIPDESDAARYLDSVTTAVERGAKLTQQLLLFSKSAHTQLSKFSINEVVNGMLDMLARLLGEQVRVQCVLDESDPALYGDRAKLEQVVMNLAVNARDAQPEGGVIELKTELVPTERIPRDEELGENHLRVFHGSSSSPESEWYVCLSVADRGIGMDRETLERVFEPFFTTKGRHGGTGLGLPVVLGIVESHNGWVEVASIPEQGTTFTLYLPAAERSETAEEEKERSPATVRSSGARVLLVEDDEEILRGSCLALRSAGYTVAPARSLDEAIDQWREGGGEYDAVITDMVLGDGSGLDLADRLGARAPRAFLVVSGYLENRETINAIRDRGYCFVEKPYSVTELMIILERELERNKD